MVNLEKILKSCNEKDPIFDKTGMKLNTNTLISGPAGSGNIRTVLSSYFLLCNGRLDKIYICAEPIMNRCMIIWMIN
jgi:hypothetical protein